MGNIKIPDIDFKQHLKAIYKHVDSLEKELDKKENQIKDLIWDNSQLEARLNGANQELWENILFPDDKKKIESAVRDYPIGSYQIGEIARISALLHKRGIDVEKHLRDLHVKHALYRQ